MRLWVEVTDASGTKLGEGPILTANGASVTRVLDGVGSVGFEVPLTDVRARGLLQNERRVNLWMEANTVVRQLGSGVIRNLKVSDTPAGKVLDVDCTDLLDELKRKSVLLNRIFSQVPLSSEVNTLVGLAGWANTVESAYASTLRDDRYDGVSVLKALQTLVENMGLHLRLAATGRTVEIGAFGTALDLTLMNVGSLPFEAYSNPQIAIIEKITEETSSEDLCNWLIPVGGGEGEAALTLAKSTRSGIGTTVVNGKTLYYIQNAASIATYGQIEDVGQFKDIVPIANTSPSQAIAANALYDAASAWLTRYAVPLKTYRVSLKKVDQLIRAGDKVRLRYSGQVETDNGTFTYLDVDDLFWVMKVTEKISSSGTGVDLQIATIDRYEQTVEQTLIGAVESINLRGLKPQTYPTTFTYTYKDFVQEFDVSYLGARKYAQFELKLDDSISSIVRVKLKFTSAPLFTLLGFTYSGAPAYVNSHFYNVYLNDQYPRGILLYINGVDRTSEFGGPWNAAPTNAAADVEIDITDRLIADGIFNEHRIEFRCTHVNADITGEGSPVTTNSAASQGVIEATFTVLAICQAILPS